MKARYVIASMFTAGLLVSAGSQAAMPSYMEQSLVAVCKASLSNRPLTFNQTMKDHRINGYRVLPNLVCNGEDIHSFALMNGADRTAKRIQHFVPGTVTIQDISMNQRIEVWFDQ
ncbi:DUF3718 domain-containing protein [Marinobacter hydrocarbonoclasticus]|nr:DUF3718 domain-containing protein [Marinobacter nauticus]